MIFNLLLNRYLFLVICLFWFIHSTLHADENGASLVNKHCAECHGDDGNGVAVKNVVIPKIAGFSAFFIYDTLAQFKAGDRKGKRIKNKNNIETDMNEISKKIPDSDAETIAIYLSKQIFKPAVQHSDQKLIAQGKQIHQDLCNDCHGENATSIADDAPILAGQWTKYLLNQFKQIADFKRYMPRKMNRKFKKLTDKDKTALLAFYANTGEKPH